jgi:transcriptional regulator NrdR family protein
MIEKPRQWGDGLACPVCRGSSQVKDSRPVAGTIRRRRSCSVCGHRWTTWETMLNAPRISQHMRRMLTAITQAEESLKLVRDDLSKFEHPEVVNDD